MTVVEHCSCTLTTCEHPELPDGLGCANTSVADGLCGHCRKNKQSAEVTAKKEELGIE